MARLFLKNNYRKKVLVPFNPYLGSVERLQVTQYLRQQRCGNLVYFVQKLLVESVHGVIAVNYRNQVSCHHKRIILFIRCSECTLIFFLPSNVFSKTKTFSSKKYSLIIRIPNQWQTNFDIKSLRLRAYVNPDAFGQSEWTFTFIHVVDELFLWHCTQHDQHVHVNQYLSVRVRIPGIAVQYVQQPSYQVQYLLLRVILQTLRTTSFPAYLK